MWILRRGDRDGGILLCLFLPSFKNKKNAYFSLSQDSSVACNFYIGVRPRGLSPVHLDISVGDLLVQFMFRQS